MNIWTTIALVAAYVFGGAFLIGAFYVMYNVFKDPNKVKEKKPNKAEKKEILEQEEANSASFFKSHNIDLGVASEANDGSLHKLKQRQFEVDNPELRPARKTPQPSNSEPAQLPANKEQNKPASRYEFPI